MKVIFLDIDCVLVTEGRHGFGIMLEPKNLKRLKWISKKTGAKIVLTTGLQCSNVHNKSSQFHAIAMQYGIKVYDYTFTAKSNGLSYGYYEIQSWLDIHPSVKNIVVLDNHNVNMGCLEKYTVHTSFDGSKDGLLRWRDNGFSTKKAREAVKMLNISYVNVYKPQIAVDREKF